MPAGEAFAHHLASPRGRAHTPHDAFTGAAGGTPCGDLVRISIALERGLEGVIADAGFDASGCGAAIACGSAAVELVRGAPLLAAARIGAAEIAEHLGGLSPAKQHAPELAADALHRALGAAARTRARLAADDERVLVAMSGGVDSAVAAILLAREAQDVVAVTLELWGDAENDGERSCCSAHAVRSARALAHRLGFPHLSIDLRAEFRAAVVEPWLDAHSSGLTPYPCARCNGAVRIHELLALRERLGAHALATGHYARVRDAADGDCGAGDRGRALLALAADERKDQTYALAALRPDAIARMRFPLGALTKARVREIAAHAQLAVARKPDSQDLCFLAGTDRARFLERHARVSPAPGPIVGLSGARLGEHAGHQLFTIGQRHGLRLGGGPPQFVLETDARSNTVVVGPRERLLTRSLQLEDVRLHRPPALVDAVKVRSRGARVPCSLAVAADARTAQDCSGADAVDRVSVELHEAIERTAPGQLACLYRGELLLGHGTIASPLAAGT